MTCRFVHFLAALSFATAMLSVPASARHERYENAKYGLSFALPAGANVCRSMAPQPNHGLLFRPAGVTSPPCDDDIEQGRRYTSVDAHFVVDGAVTAANFVSAECPQMALDSQGRVTAIDPPVRPGRLNWVGCRIDGRDGAIEEIMFGQRKARAGVPPIDYTLVLKTTVADYSVDRAAFRRWLATVSLDRPR